MRQRRARHRVVLALIFARPPRPKSGGPSAQSSLTDPAGDVKPISTTKTLSPASTSSSSPRERRQAAQIGGDAEGSPGAFATDVVELFFDTDNNSKTGRADVLRGADRLRVQVEAHACAKYTNGGSACSGPRWETR